MRYIFFLFFGGLCLCFPANASTEHQDFTAARNAFFIAIDLLENSESIVERTEALDAVFDTSDALLKSLRALVRLAESKKERRQSDLNKKRRVLAEALGALQAMHAAPIPMLLLHPSGIEGTMQASIMLRAQVPRLQLEIKKAEDILREREEIANIFKEQMDSVDAFARLVHDARMALNSARSARIAPPKNFIRNSEAREILSRFLGQLSLLEQKVEVPDGLDTVSFFAQKGQHPWPIGLIEEPEIVESTTNGEERFGVTLRVDRPMAVYAPYDATVLFAGPYLNYEHVVILELSQRHTLLLSGLGHTNREPLEIVFKGEPIGFFGGTAISSDDQKNSYRLNPFTGLVNTLYLELWEDGSPIDPRPWFTNQRSP